MPDSENTMVNRVLVIDDNPNIFDDFQAILQGTKDNSGLDALNAELFGGEVKDAAPCRTYQLDYASQGKEGYEKVKRALKQEQPYQLAFVDMRMPPGWDGLETIRPICRIDPHLQIVICTAYSDYSWEEITKRLGTSDNLLILKKPFDVAEVAQLASALTKKWHLKRLAALKIEEMEQKVKEHTRALVEANERLRENEEKLRNLYNNAQVGLFRTTISDGKLLEANDLCAKLFGYDNRYDFIAEYVPAEHYVDPNSHEQILKEIQKTGQIRNLEAQFTDRYGSPIWLSYSARIYPEEGYIEGAIIDITKRKRVEVALIESEEKYRTLFEDSLEAMSLTQDGKMVDVNPSWLRLHGYDHKNEVIGIDITNVIYREDQKILIERREMWPNIKESIYPLRDVRKDGSVVDVEVYSSRISLDGKDAILATIRDVSERKRAEAERRDLEKKLRHSGKMEAIGTLAGGVAHDLNNVLSGLIGYPELLLMDMPEDNPYRKYILKIQKSGEKAAAIVQDLLTLARRGVAVTEVVNLETIIREYLMSPEHEKVKLYYPKLQVETNFETDLLNILGSPVHLSKTVMNLVSNSAEAMPGGGKISISIENCYIDRRIKGYDNVAEGDYVVLTVKDTGSGIPPEELDKIFEPFYTKKVMGKSGTGLGMAVVWGTVKDHNGYIDVQSAKGKGTTFTLYFPVTRKECAKDDSIFTIEYYTGNGQSLLVVDDVEEQREIASEMLQTLGYSVTKVSSGEEAVDHMKNNSADLLVLDMIMDPGIDGLETYKKILELHPGQKAIIASGFSETERVKEAQKLGAGEYVKKPYTLEKIGLAVKEELSN